MLPLHPRTAQRLDDFGLRERAEKELILLRPLGYIDFLSLTSNARIILTDSGGLQEESTALGIPCLTLRENTERPATVTAGTNRIVGTRTVSTPNPQHRATPEAKRRRKAAKSARRRNRGTR